MDLTAIDPEVRARAARIRLVAIDIDGALTDGKLYYSDETEFIKAFHSRDGLGIRLAQKAGIDFVIITGRKSRMVELRAAELDIEEVHQGEIDKGTRLDSIRERRGLPLDEVCMFGDDIVDLPALRRCGLAAAPADAVDDVLAAAHFVTRQTGGHGALREVLELILRSSGAWERVAAPFYR